MRLPILVSIRDKATRLPGKSFLEIGGLPAVDLLVGRMQRARRADGVVICTSVHPEDAVFDAVAERTGAAVFHGSEDDKLVRYLAAARHLGSDFVVVVDGDDVLCDPAQVDRVLAAWLASAGTGEPLDYVIVDQLPVGGTGFGVRVEALARVVELKAESDTEVWGGYFTQTGLFRPLLLEPDSEALRRPDVRFTLDYPEDLEIFRAVFERAGRTDIDLAEAIRAYDADPALAALAGRANARWIPHLARSAPVRLKS